VLTTFYVFLKYQLNKRKNAFLKSEKNVKYVLLNTVLVLRSLHPRWHLERLSRFARLTIVTNRHTRTDRQTTDLRYSAGKLSKASVLSI